MFLQINATQRPLSSLSRRGTALLPPACLRRVSHRGDDEPAEISAGRGCFLVERPVFSSMDLFLSLQTYRGSRYIILV